MSQYDLETEGILPPEIVATNIARALKIGTGRGNKQWSPTGDIYLDYDPNRDLEVQEGVVETQALVARLINEALVYERSALRDAPFDSFDSYLRFLISSGYMSDRDISSRTVAAIQSGIVSHWNKAKAQVRESPRGIAEFFDFDMDILNRKTKWKTLSYAEEVQKGGYLEFKYGFSPDDLKEPYFTSAYVTHTTRRSNALSIVKQNVIQADNRNNFSVSSVVSRHPEDITLILDLNDLIKAVPLMHGLSMEPHENEVTSHFPVSTKLIRAVVPASVFNQHPTQKYRSGGTTQQALDLSLLRR